MASPRLLFADPEGRLYDHPTLLAAARHGEAVGEPDETPVPLPEFGRVTSLPGRLPIGIDPETGEPIIVDEITVDGRTFVPTAVGAFVQPGWTRTLLPADEPLAGAPVLPQWAYTAAGWGEDGPVVWALHTDRRTHWDPRQFSTPELEGLVHARLLADSSNRILRQLKICALEYRCFTSQNLFYCRDEGAIPASIMCNARCVGCISDQPEDGPPASHERMDDAPLAEEMARVGIHHLVNAPGRTMVSFGQGCEGEPLTRWKVIEKAIRKMREATSRGSININTNGSLTEGLDALFAAGLDAVRVSLNSANPSLYSAYYRPIGYDFSDVDASIGVARKRGGYVALNLLLFPGVTDREGEVEALCDLVARHRVDQVQTRSLCIDPQQYLAVAAGAETSGDPIGVPQLLERLQKARPGLVIGNFARGLDER
ncbi:radical SAM protein [Vulgatibacter incomptus]|uniref:Radical SAM domain protein n=1 Tax=Vulgatibacter incomptus TaxID=1391653 RepID=A0A0K1PE14_9BACT|nr:radical SAM protein [Vulgatibacter incomptus]AKU91666.1 Radical SAM domain protein [Vulgatibacter incomptus]